MTQIEAAHAADPQSVRLRALEQLLAIHATALKPALDEASTIIADALGADKVDTFLYEPARHTLVAMGTSRTPLGQRQKALGLDQLPLANGGRSAEVFVTGQVYHYGQVDTDEGELVGIREGLGICSVVVVPLDIDGVRRGVVQADAVERDAFSLVDRAFLEAVAHWVGLIIMRAELNDQRLRDASAQARRLAAEELITVLAHDLGNYLTPVLGRLYILRRRAEREHRPTDAQEVAAVEHGMQRLQRLMDDLLDVGRIEQGLFAIQRQPVNLADLARDSADGVRSPRFEIAVDAPDELVAEADLNRLRQALENLLSNARKHAAGSRVVVAVGQEQRVDGTWAILKVQDQGPGIAPEVQQQLTERFVRGHGSRGLGLGLYLVRGIAEAHGGTLTVESRLGRGTTFQIALPMQQGDTGH
jgi:signal transduction histidine kinase